MPAVRTTLKPPSSMRQPMTSSVSWKKSERDPRMRGTGRTARATRSRQHDRRRAIAEECRRDHVCDRSIGELQGQGAELDGEQHRDLIPKAPEVVGGARGAGGAADAAETEHRRALHVGAHPEPVDELDVDGRRSNPGHGGEEEMIHVGRREAASTKRGLEGLAAELSGDAHPSVVRRCERAQRPILVHRQRQMAAANSRGAVDPFEASTLVAAGAPFVQERR